MENILIFIVLAALTFVNTIVPISGSSTTTPLLALITDPHTAIGLASFYFALSGIIRVFVFRKDVRLEYVKYLLPVSLAGAIFGAFALVQISSQALLIIILGFLIYFLYKKIRAIYNQKRPSAKINKLTSGFVGLFSGFLQGAGVAGSDLRNGYLYSEKLSLTEVRGTSSFIGATNFLSATLVRVHTDQVKVADLTMLLYLLPFMIIATYFGRKALLKINKKHVDYFVLVFMGMMIILMVFEIFGINVKI